MRVSADLRIRESQGNRVLGLAAAAPLGDFTESTAYSTLHHTGAF